MADASYLNGVITDNGSDSSRTDPITLNEIVSAAAPITRLSNSVAYQDEITERFTSTGAATFTLGHNAPSIQSVTVNGVAQVRPGDYGISNNVITFTSGSIPGTGATVIVTYTVSPEFSLGTGIYNFTAAQLTLTGSGATSASRFQIGPDAGGTAVSTVYVGYDNVAVPSNPNDFSHIRNEDFVLNFDDADIVTTASSTSIAPAGSFNYILRNTGRLDVSTGNRMVVNLPRRSAHSDGGQTSAGVPGGGIAVRNVFYIENNDQMSNIRMTVNMGAYANDVLYDNPPDTNIGNSTGGGPSLANSLQYYNVASTVSVRDILYRGDYVDWRPQGQTWAPLTGGGFFGDNGIKWLITGATTGLVSNTNPLTFGSFDSPFVIGVGQDSTRAAANGNGFFELGLSPNTDRINRIVFRNATGIDWNERLALWNGGNETLGGTGRLRVENQTAQEFHIFDDVRESLDGARVVVNHFYPTYLSNNTDTPTTNFTRSVLSTAVTGMNGRATVGNDPTDYANALPGTTAAARLLDTSNRPIIVEAVELNAVGGGGQIIQGAYKVSSQNTTIAHNVYTENGTATDNAATYDAYAYGHEPRIGFALAFTPSGPISGGPRSTVEVPLTRDSNITERVAANVPARASSLENIYDMLSLWAFNNRTTHPLTVLGNTLRFGERQVTFSRTATEVAVSDTAITIPILVTTDAEGNSVANVAAGGTGKFNSIQTTPRSGRTTGFVLTDIRLDGVTVVGTMAPSVNIVGLNGDQDNNNHIGRLDVYDSTDNPFDATTLRRSLTYSNGNTRLLASTTTNVPLLQFDRSDTMFTNIGLGGTITTLTAVYSRPGVVPQVFDIDVSTADDREVRITELGQPYPITADLTEESQPTWVATPEYVNSTGILTATISGGGTNTSLSDTQLNRLFSEDIFGTRAFNEFLYTSGAIFGMGSRNNDSFWFANSDTFQTATANRVIVAGYIQNMTQTDPALPFNMPTNIPDPSDPTVTIGQAGVFHNSIPAEFDLSAVRAVTDEQTMMLSTQLSSFQGDPEGTTTTLNDINTNINSTRNTIIGNL